MQKIIENGCQNEREMVLPLVSVVIPFYSNVNWLTEAVESVFAQTYKNFEVIVINDGSTENMEQFIKVFEGRIKYIYKANGGPGSARNVGIEKSIGKYIAFLDSDDIWLPNKLELQVMYMEKSGFAWSHCSYETFGNGPHYVLDAIELSGYVYPRAMISPRIGTPCVIISSSILKNNRQMRFNEKMRYSQDIYMWALLSKEYELGAIHEILCKVRMRELTAERSIFIQLNGRGQLWDELKRLSNSDEYISPLPMFVRAAYGMCSNARKKIIKLKKLTNNDKLIELMSGVLYLLPYVVLKIYKTIMEHVNVKQTE